MQLSNHIRLSSVYFINCQGLLNGSAQQGNTRLKLPLLILIILIKTSTNV